MATAVYSSFKQICDANGVPISGAKVYIYDVGTTTLKTVYSDPDLDVSHVADNPIVTDAYGRHAMRYIATGSYKAWEKTSADVSIRDAQDDIDGGIPVGTGALAIANGGTGETTANGAVAALGAATASEVADLAADVAALSGAQASSEKTHIATGTTAQRPPTPVDGDIRRNTTLNQWEGYNGNTAAWEKIVVSPNINADMPIGSIVKSTSASYTANTDITGTIPYDNTIPQVGEGTQIISVAHTALSATNVLRFRLTGTVACGTSGVVPIIAVFKDGGANAIGSFEDVIGDNAGGQSIAGMFEHTPGDTSAHTFTVRVGTNGGSTIRFNGTSSAARFSTANAGTWLLIEEVKA